MKIELKNIKINQAFSEETTCFKADLYIDGKKVGYASNDGRGGCTDYGVFKHEDRPLLEKADEYCKTLPEKDLGSFKLAMNLEHFIDELIYAEDGKKFEKKLQKDMLKGLCFGTKSSYTLMHWKGRTLAEILAIPQGRMLVEQEIMKARKNGKELLNTNIPELLTAV